MRMRKRSTFLGKLGFTLLVISLAFTCISGQSDSNSPSQSGPQTENHAAVAPNIATNPAPTTPSSEADPAKFSSWQVIGPTGGDIRTIAIDPRDKNKIYV